ncbi:Alpha/Beta hydrolase protein [Stachybotrys elegans]|uniref:Alpha/Beta hydrolase protein n=1 Tax=Stachybotrys elegans TaxID=80388 RepID=A0A8K0SQN7_9HYPO|nr:Alpha/Beta hydrolase protein [Stachybotrys elegans]
MAAIPRFLAACMAMASPLVYAQLLQPQTNTWNSTFSLTEEQIASLNLSATAANNINIAARFEQSNWATGSVFTDPFYTHLPTNASWAPAGSVLKVEAFTSTSTYTISPALALSRIVYQSKTLNGTLVPVSAFILWPYRPRGGASVSPLVSWGHGTSGLTPECGPSHVRNLWQQFAGPYSLALAGYAVVATDYAGLGVPVYPDGSEIIHQYLASPASGNDMLYAAQAAQAAFPGELSPNFAVVGHSQGGGAAWGAARQQVEAQVPGYLGAIAVAPVTDAIGTGRESGALDYSFITIAKSLLSIFPSLSLSQMLTSTGINTVRLFDQVQACNSVINTAIIQLLAANATLSRHEFWDSIYISTWEDLVRVSEEETEGPLLVIHGVDDAVIPEALTFAAVRGTCDKFPRTQLQYIRAAGMTHTSTLYATQQIWFEWLDARFDEAARRVRRPNHKSCECKISTIGSQSPRPLDQYRHEPNYYLMFALDFYQVA